jgi:tetratricopeptide (TPR) repeat protein
LKIAIKLPPFPFGAVNASHRIRIQDSVCPKKSDPDGGDTMKRYVLASALIIGLVALATGFMDLNSGAPTKKSPVLFKEAVNLHQKSSAGSNTQEIIQKYDQALKVAGREGDTQIEAAGLFNMGALYCDTHRYREAAQCYQKAMTLFRETRNAEGEWLTLSGLRMTYANRNSRHKALNTTQMKSSNDAAFGKTENGNMLEVN